MSTTIKCSFPSGRYHATPWESHPNEGLVEWPPSPWRLLRALLSCWYWKAKDEIEATRMDALVEALASEAPCFYVPYQTTEAHTRHYMPLYGIDKTTKIFDTFLHIDEGDALWVHWRELTLPDGLVSVLSVLLSRLSYLGRAESWVEAELVDLRALADAQEVGHLRAYLPVAIETLHAPLQSSRPLLAPLPQAELVLWRDDALGSLRELRLALKREKLRDKGKDPNKAKLSKKEEAAMAAMFPEHVRGVLEVETNDLQKQGWSMPPGSTWLSYAAEEEVVRRAASSERKSGERLPTVAHFVLSSPVLPRMTEAHILCDVVHQALISGDSVYPVFTGKDMEGVNLQGHRHVRMLPVSGDGRHISRLVLVAEMGFARDAQDALRRFRTLWTGKQGGGRRWGSRANELRLVLAGMGQVSDFAGLQEQAGECPLLVESRVWHSVTPFVPTRHPKFRGRSTPKLDERGEHIGSPLHDLRRLLCMNGYGDPVSIEPLEHALLGGRSVPWHQFKTRRSGGNGVRAGRLGYGFRIEFAEAVRGPICVGYGAHFGLGVFAPGESLTL